MTKYREYAVVLIGVGQKAAKRSGRSFKSGRKVNTVKDCVTHPQLKTPAYSFVEDDSIVSVLTCRPPTNAELVITKRYYDD